MPKKCNAVPEYRGLGGTKEDERIKGQLTFGMSTHTRGSNLQRQLQLQHDKMIQKHLTAT